MPAETIKAGAAVESNDVSGRVNAEFGRSAEDGKMKFEGVGVSADVRTGFTTLVGAEVKVGPESLEVSIGSRPTPLSPELIETKAINPLNGQEVSLPGIVNGADRKVEGTIVGVGAQVGFPSQNLNSDPNGVPVNAAPFVDAGVGVNLKTGDTAAKIIGGADITSAPGSGPGITVGGQVTLDPGGRVSAGPYIGQPGRNGSALEDVVGTLRETAQNPRAPITETRGDARDALYRDPMYAQAVGAMKEQGYTFGSNGDGQSERIAAAVVQAAKEQGLGGIKEVHVGNTVIDANGKSDRNIFVFDGEPNAAGTRQARTSENVAINTPVEKTAEKIDEQAIKPHLMESPSREASALKL
jgi:hypothetical protein